MSERTLEAIAARLQSVAHITINGGGDNVGGKYYGTRLEIGRNEVKFWHVEEHDAPRVLPSRLELEAGCGEKDSITVEEFFGDCYPCSSHWQSQGDYDMAEFIRHARQDIAALLALHGIQVDVKEGRW